MDRRRAVQLRSKFRDAMPVSDIVGIIGASLTLVAAGATVVAVKYARDSARAAQGTVEPLETTADTLRTLLREEQTARRVRQLERVADAIAHLLAAQRQHSQNATREASEESFRTGNTALISALSAFTSDELPTCRRVAHMPTLADTMTSASVQNAETEIQDALKQAHQELQRLADGEAHE
jgi:hypothetical protein